jgi:hypothetical protein
MVDCSALQASTPSFVDELVKAVLVDRRGQRLVIKGAPDRTLELARQAAQNRGVIDRLETGQRSPQVWRASRSCSSSQPR